MKNQTSTKSTSQPVQSSGAKQHSYTGADGMSHSCKIPGNATVPSKDTSRHR